jgi:hypothetical protein
MQAFVVPALRKKREGRGTHCVGDASEIKSLGHPPDLVTRTAEAAVPTQDLREHVADAADLGAYGF